jgi:hypothetical protein
MQMAEEVSAQDDRDRPKVLAKFAPSRSDWRIAARQGETRSFELNKIQLGYASQAVLQSQ